LIYLTRGAGFVPCNSELVIAKLDIKLRTATSDIESMNLSEPWQSQTPHNPIKVHFHFVFLRKTNFKTLKKLSDLDFISRQLFCEKNKNNNAQTCISKSRT
jgi:hypothetical protein